MAKYDPDELFNGILARLLNNVPSDVDKREGSIIYNALAPVALELQEVYEELEGVLEDTFADTASLDYLVLRAAERGIQWMQATHAVLNAQLTFDNTVTEEPEAVGAMFALENSTLMYTVTDRVSWDADTRTGIYLITAEDEGIIGNVGSGDLIIEEADDDALVDNLQTAVITGIHNAARDDEDVESLRARYFDSINNEAFGGNVADYREKALEQTMVGAVQVVPVWNGGGTVKLRFLDGAYGIPTQNEVTALQNVFDPVPQGEGYGLAPVGHTVTVVGATDVPISVTANVTFDAGYDWESLYTKMLAECEAYLLSLRKAWQSGAVTVSPGVLAYLIKANVPHIGTLYCTINGNQSDFVLDPDEAPTLSELVEG